MNSNTAIHWVSGVRSFWHGARQKKGLKARGKISAPENLQQLPSSFVSGMALS
jgi:hypothetical protein